MSKIGIFYSFRSTKTAKAAEKIIEAFGNDYQIDKIDADTVNEEQFLSYNKLILGVPTWFDGELPNYWDEFVPALEDLDLTGKKVAVWGMGDQVGYPENFGDAAGIMCELLSSRGAIIIGATSTDGYVFESSKALVGNKFCGLILDQENQARLSSHRIEQWVNDLKKNFK